jgi:hypothetical protein
MNKMVNGKQLTILWHINDLKISHKSPDVVTDMLGTINKQYGNEVPITSPMGKCTTTWGWCLTILRRGK